ncbi:DUF1566 domain-containing protein [Legionella sp. km772]|uniref:DUF1566 domain-containing protein n=1 Tax=Legionella sp. km772 TaxID=2498111 RepID=UPI001315765A|nr:DUF1566 domain-containing protein [Legionella sp. km772]
MQNKVSAELSAEEPSDSVSVFSTNPLAESPTHTHLAASINNLALSVTGHTEHGVIGTPLSGAARIITIKNLGEVEAEHLMIMPPIWPLNTVSTTTCGNSLAPGAHCIITVIPGSVASSDGTHPCSNGTTPIPEVIQVSADNAEPVSINTVILNYGCIYQGGYVYAFDDTTPNTKSVGGKVVALMDQNPQNSGISWNPQAQNVDIENDWTLIDASNPAIDNSSDDDFILVNHEQTEDEAATNQAAEYCHQSFSGYDNWYLPTICEMGYGSDLCGNEGAPVLQNMQSNLVDFNNLNLLRGNYWSSTEVLSYPYDYAWRQNFAPSGDSSQFPIHKNEPLKVRCARALTN